MIIIREQSGKTTTYITDYIADTEEELEELPISPQCAKGSTCLCVENNSLYLLDGTNHWVRV